MSGPGAENGTQNAQIRLRGIERVFQLGDAQVHALRGVALDVACGEYLAVMGPSGSGKSTLLNLLGLLDRPNAGSYWLEGRDVTTLGADEQARVRSQRIGFVFQSFHLVPRLSAAENIALPMVLAGVASDERARRVARALQDYGLENRADHRPDELSGGQRQRVAIARATVMQPAMILADEPTGNLDRATGDEVVRLLEGLNAQGVTLVVVTHDAALGARAHRRIAMEDGAITLDTAQAPAVPTAAGTAPETAPVRSPGADPAPVGAPGTPLAPAPWV
ncbi:MAG: ATP-binding cassette domain-containing protein [Rhodoferax sp.]